LATTPEPTKGVVECGGLPPLWFRGGENAALPPRVLLAQPPYEIAAAARGRVGSNHETESGGKPCTLYASMPKKI
jgi:hypothetical protein